jgi:membrane-bound lytic murein transglycosylase MltF
MLRIAACWVLAGLVIATLGAGLAAAQEAAPAQLGQRIHQPWKGDLDGMLERRILRVLVPFSRTHYFLDGARQRGLSYEAFEKFEKFLWEKYELKPLAIDAICSPTPRDEMFPRLLEGRGDIIVAALTVTPERQALVDFADPVATGVKELIVTGPGTPAIARLEELSGREVWVRESSSYQESLQALNAQFAAAGVAPVTVHWSAEDLETEDLLEMVNAGLIPATIADSYLLELWGEVFEGLRFDPEVVLRDDVEIAWAFRKDSPKLAAATNEFVVGIRKGTLTGNILYKRYLKSNPWVKSATSAADRKRFESVLPMFEKYATRYELDPVLEAAQGYQESGLDQGVRSKAGAIGVMQVLQSTASSPEVGIPDIENLEANIHAGNKYMRVLADRYFPDLAHDPIEQQLFCLAAYNAGPTRIRRLRGEAAAEGLNPDEWFGNVEVLVARKVGREPVVYVRNIYKYYIAFSLVAERAERRERARQQH